MSVLVNGAVHQSGVSASVQHAISQGISAFNALQQTINNNSSLRAEYQRYNRQAQAGIAAWMRRNSFSSSDSVLIFDSLGMPYHRDGRMTVVVGHEIPLRSSAGGSSTRQPIGSYAIYDFHYNRIVIQPWFANALAGGLVYYKDSGGNFRQYTFRDLLHHEYGHAGDIDPASGRPVSRSTYLNSVIDNYGERFEEIGHRALGVPQRAPHGMLYFKDGDQYLNPMEGSTLVRLRAFQQRMGAPLAPTLGIIKDASGQFHIINAATGETSPVSMVNGTLGRMAGSALGNYLARENGTVMQVAASTALGSIGQSFGNALALYGKTQDLSASLEAAFRDFHQTLFNNLKGAAVGSLSAYLSLELGRELGLKGFGAELFNVASGSATGPILDKVLSNISSGSLPFKDFSLGRVFGSPGQFADLLGSSFASFFGAKLGSLVISPTTSSGAALASLGSAVGAWALSAGGSQAIGGVAAAIFSKLGVFGSVLGPGIGSFVGFILGALLGSLFGKRKPRIPTAEAQVLLNLSASEFQLGAVTVQNGGSRDLALNMATVARDALNGLVEVVLGVNPGTLGSSSTLNQSYGHYGNDIRAKQGNGAWQTFTSADAAVEWGVLGTLRQTSIAGGDILAKRAIYTSPAASLVALFGDLQVARDYHLYLQNAEVINNLISMDSRSDFSAAWVATLARVAELGLNKFQRSDFYGGLRGFATSFGFGGKEGLPFESLRVTVEGGSVRISTTDGSAPFGLFAAQNDRSGADGSKSVLIRDFAQNVGYAPWAGQATAGNDLWVAASSGHGVTMDDTSWQEHWWWNPWDYSWEVTYSQVSGGDDIFVGSSFNDHLYGRSGDDWLDGGEGHDWIEGGDGDDVILGGGGVDRLMGGAGNDYISGGDGHDYPADWMWGQPATGGLWGGTGNDTLVGGSGQDALFGEEGDDVLIVDQDGGGTFDYLHGGAGSDTASFERFSAGVYVDMRNGKDGHYSTITYGDGWVSIENLTGSRHSDTLIGDSDHNVIRGLSGNDTIYGLEGNDVIEGGAGSDLMYGGAGVDTLSYENSSAAVVINLGTGVALGGDAGGDVFAEFENIRGSQYHDELTGDAGNNLIQGLAGDDRIFWSAGSDTVEGGSGFDIFDASGANGALTLYSGGYAYAGSGYSYLTSIEGIVGTPWGDSISGTAADELFDGGAGNDWMNGGGGSDTYVFGRGDGWDTVVETNDGHNSILLKEGINWRDVAIWGAGSSGSLTVAIRDTGEYITVGSNWSYVSGGAHNHKIKTLDLGGVSAIDIGVVDWTPAGADSEGATSVFGAQGKADLIFAYGGADYIVTAGYAGAYEINSNIVYAGDGNDTIISSAGDDTFIFERGNGRDYLSDSGGRDTIVMGPSVAADDVIYEVVVTSTDGYGGQRSDLYIGIRDLANPELRASQVADHIRVVDGGTILYDLTYGSQTLNTIEHIRVGGQEIDLTKAGINWTTSYYQSYSGGGGGGGGGGYPWDPGGGGHIPPLAIDLDGDGIELRSVEGSRITTIDADGSLWRIGWLGPDDGFLALDRNGDGVIDRLAEISFTQDKEGAKTDLEGLAAYDSNEDGILDANDERWGEFKVWRDLNQDGIGTGKELMSLADAGIVSISLKGTPTGFTAADGIDNAVLATTVIGWADPNRTGLGYDIALAARQVRSDGGDKEKADKAAKANGKDKADAIDAQLYGIQTLTAAEIEAVKAKKDKKDKAEPVAVGGLLGRVEEFLAGAEKGADGLLKLKDAKAVHDKKVNEAKAAEKDAKKDKFAKSGWSVEPAGPASKRDLKGDHIVGAAEPGLSGKEKADFDKAIAFFENEKKLKKAEAEALAARDAAENEALLEAPPLPTAEEMARMQATDTFRLLAADGDAEESPDMPGEDEEWIGIGEEELDALASDLARQLSSGAGASYPPADEPRAETTQAAEKSGDSAEDTASAGKREAEELPSEAAPAETAAAAELEYGADIAFANARLIQALGGFGRGAPMMASHHGLRDADADAQSAWMTVGRQASVQNLLHIA
ncbi:MAG: calcium-binding protein [Allosphingosinicella sp.]|uniref:calcium-binding protein n=1 Tax=Allosphingosinicella sp. TaxID=2823234 RepID=UPI00394EE2E6